MSETNELKKIPLGSGKLYMLEFDGTTIPADTVIETDANLLGLVQGGASLEYAQTIYTASDDLGLAKRTVLTNEEVKLKSGVMTWNAYTLSKLVSTGRVTEDADNKRRILKIGGIGNNNGKRYLTRFVNIDPEFGNTKITVVGTNGAGLSLAYVKDKETVVNAEIIAEPLDSDGTLVIYDEPLQTAGGEK